MADQKNRGGQKQGNQQPGQPDQAQGTATQGAGERGDRDKQADQMNNPDDARRQPTDVNQHDQHVARERHDDQMSTANGGRVDPAGQAKVGGP